jgi:hypothetical protein
VPRRARGRVCATRIGYFTDMNWTERRPNGATRHLAQHPYGWSFFYAVVLSIVVTVPVDRSSGVSTGLIWAAGSFVILFGFGSWYWGISRRGEKWQEHYDATHGDRASPSA